MGKIARIRKGLEKSESVGLNASEMIVLRGEIAGLAAKVARVNALAQREVVSLSSFAKMAGAPAVAV